MSLEVGSGMENIMTGVTILTLIVLTFVITIAASKIRKKK
jgi:hypothetical protein